MAEKRTKSDAFMLRFPEGMRERLKDYAADSQRSLNSEIIDRLDKSIKRWFFLDVPEDLMDRVAGLPPRTFDELAAEISRHVVIVFEKATRRHDDSRKNLLVEFQLMIEEASEEDQHRLISDFQDLMRRAGLDGDTK